MILKSLINLGKRMNILIVQLDEYYISCRLRANPPNENTGYFALHLSNRYTNQILNFKFSGQPINFSSNPTYFGVTLDKSHLTNVTGKLNSRNNNIHK